jgi:hypothetical protein
MIAAVRPDASLQNKTETLSRIADTGSRTCWGEQRAERLGPHVLSGSGVAVNRSNIRLKENRCIGDLGLVTRGCSSESWRRAPAWREGATR